MLGTQGIELTKYEYENKNLQDYRPVTITGKMVSNLMTWGKKESGENAWTENRTMGMAIISKLERRICISRQIS
jgi:hypothetical protein